MPHPKRVPYIYQTHTECNRSGSGFDQVFMYSSQFISDAIFLRVLITGEGNVLTSLPADIVLDFSQIHVSFFGSRFLFVDPYLAPFRQLSAS